MKDEGVRLPSRVSCHSHVLRRDGGRKILVPFGHIDMGAARRRVPGFHRRDALFLGTAAEISEITIHETRPPHPPLVS